MDKQALADSQGFIQAIWDTLGEPKLRQWVKSVNPDFELGPWKPGGNIMDHLREQEMRDMQTEIMRSATSRDKAPIKILKGYSTMLGQDWDEGKQQQAETIRDNLSEISPYLMRWAPNWWDAMHGGEGSVASLASAIADAHKYDDDMTAEKAVQMAEEMAEDILSDPMKHRGMSLQEIGGAYREATKRGWVGTGTDTETQIKDLTPILGATSAVRDALGPEGYDTSDMAGMFQALDKIAPNAHYNFDQADKNIRVGRYFQQRGGIMGAAMDAAGETIPEGGASLAELNAQNEILTQQAAKSHTGNLVLATARAAQSGAINENSEAKRWLDKIQAGELSYIDPSQWRQMMARSGASPAMAAMLAGQSAENQLFLAQNPNYKNLIRTVRMTQPAFDHNRQLALAGRRFGQGPGRDMLMQGEKSRLAKQWGYRNRQHYDQLQGGAAAQIGNVYSQAENQARVEQQMAHLGQKGPVRRFVHEVQRGTQGPAEFAAGVLGGVRTPAKLPGPLKMAADDSRKHVGFREWFEKTALNSWAKWGLGGAALGGGISALSEFVDDPYPDDERPTWRRVLESGLMGAGVGGALGLAGKVYWDAVRQEMERRRSNFGPYDPTGGADVKEHKLTLRDQLDKYYKDAPGGLDEAVRRAQESMANDNDPYGIHRWDPAELDTETTVSTVDREYLPPLPGQAANFGVKGVYDPNDETLWAAAPGHAMTDDVTSNIEHELTHARLRAPGPAQNPGTRHPRVLHYDDRPRVQDMGKTFWGSRKTRTVPRKTWEYATTPEELKAYLATVKREYVQATGKHVSTPQEAEKALNWFFRQHKGEHEQILDAVHKPLMENPREKDVLLRQLMQIVGITSKGVDDISKMAMDKTAARGIPDRTDFGDPSKLDTDELVDLFVQRHRAQRAGEHFDYRLGTPETGLLSWATKPTHIPAPGEKKFMKQQPVHSHQYGAFQGSIGSGYGKGEVRQERRGKVMITKATPTKIEYTVATTGTPERYVLMKPEKWGDRDWLMINVTPKKAVPYDKVRYKKLAPEDVEPYIEQMKEGTSVSAKLDGASSLVKLMRGGAEVLSYRTAKRTGHPIVHTERMFGGRPQLDIPKKYEGSVLKGELYAEKIRPDDVSRPTSDDAGVEEGAGVAAQADEAAQVLRAVEPQRLGGLLHATVEHSRDKQREQGLDIKNMLFDIQQLGKTPIDPNVTPYAERRKMIEEILPYLPPDKFQLAEETTDPEEAKQLWHSIIAGKHPLTREGIVFQPPVGKPTKAKRLEESDVHITDVFPGGGKYQGTGAGGFGYALAPGGPRAGEVGTGLSDELRAQLLADPAAYIGRVARIRSQEQYPSGAWRAPALIAMHEDY